MPMTFNLSKSVAVIRNFYILFSRFVSNSLMRVTNIIGYGTEYSDTPINTGICNFYTLYPVDQPLLYSVGLTGISVID